MIFVYHFSTKTELITLTTKESKITKHASATMSHTEEIIVSLLNIIKNTCSHVEIISFPHKRAAKINRE